MNYNFPISKESLNYSVIFNHRQWQQVSGLAFLAKAEPGKETSIIPRALSLYQLALEAEMRGESVLIGGKRITEIGFSENLGEDN